MSGRGGGGNRGGGGQRNAGGGGGQRGGNGGHRGGGSGGGGQRSGGAGSSGSSGANNYGKMKKLEHKTAKESYDLINKYTNKGSGMDQRYNREYNKAVSKPDHRINYNKVQPGSGGYTGAIQQRGQLLRKAEARSGGADAQAFARVHQNAGRVADARDRNLRLSNSIGGWAQYLSFGLLKTDTQYNNHKHAAQTWREAHK